jgi:hypothetical protein
MPAHRFVLAQFAMDSILAKCGKFQLSEKSNRNIAPEPTTASGASVRFASKAVQSPQGMSTGGVMFFLLRMTFWLAVVCVLLPGGGDKANNGALSQIDPVSAVSAAGAAMSDMRGFCDRQPQACVVGGKVAVALGHKAEAGARTLFDMVSGQIMDQAEKPAADAKMIPAAASGTLTASDLAPNWHAPVPLPPRREARATRPSV